jgi:hypothetical protein
MAEDITTLLQALSQYETQVSIRCTNLGIVKYYTIHIKHLYIYEYMLVT